MVDTTHDCLSLDQCNAPRHDCLVDPDEANRCLSPSIVAVASESPPSIVCDVTPAPGDANQCLSPVCKVFAEPSLAVLSDSPVLPTGDANRCLS